MKTFFKNANLSLILEKKNTKRWIHDFSDGVNIFEIFENDWGCHKFVQNAKNIVKQW